MKMGNPEMVQPREPVAQNGFVYQMGYVQVRFIYISKKYSQINIYWKMRKYQTHPILCCVSPHLI